LMLYRDVLGNYWWKLISSVGVLQSSSLMLCYFIDAQLFLQPQPLSHTINIFCFNYNHFLWAKVVYVTENKQPGENGCYGKGGVTHSLTPRVLYKVKGC
jgi:hypothetical protein